MAAEAQWGHLEFANKDGWKKVKLYTRPSDQGLLSHEKKSGWLFYMEDYTTQLYRDYNKINKPL